MLQDGYATVKGIIIEFSEQVVAEAIGLPTIGEKWSEDMDGRAAKAQFILHSDPPLQEDKKQGTLWLSLPLQFIQPTTFIMRYFTCEGHCTYLHAVHFKILCGLWHDKRPINLPSFLYNIVKWKATFVQAGRAQSVSHHCLIQAIVERELNRQNLGIWDDFVKLQTIEPQRGGPRGQGMGVRQRTIVGAKKVVYKMVQEASTSMSTPRVTKKRTSHLEVSASKRRKT